MLLITKTTCASKKFFLKSLYLTPIKKLLAFERLEALDIKNQLLKKLTGNLTDIF